MGGAGLLEVCTLGKEQGQEQQAVRAETGAGGRKRR